jgi:hypothetical protein
MGKQKEIHRTPLIWRLQDFFLFPRLKSIMNGARFADVAAIQERVTAVLRSIPKEAFADSFQKLYERCQLCVVKDGDYFGKANKVNLFVYSVLFVFWYNSPNFLDTPRIMRPSDQQRCLVLNSQHTLLHPDFENIT